LGGRASGKYRKQGRCGKGYCHAMAHGFSFFSAKAKLSVVVYCPRCAAGLYPCPLFRAYPNSGCMTALIGPFVLIVFFARLFLPAITKNALRTLALRTLWPF
jgi:hypothetical protein